MKKTRKRRGTTGRLSEQYSKYFAVPPRFAQHNADSPNDLRQPPALKPVPSVVTYGVDEKPIMH